MQKSFFRTKVTEPALKRLTYLLCFCTPICVSANAAEEQPSVFSFSQMGQEGKMGSQRSVTPNGLASTFDLIAQEDALKSAANELEAQEAAQKEAQAQAQGPVINFNNVNIVEFLRFVSRLTGRNFIFDPQELQFPVTIISESPASLDDIMAALLQNLRIHEFELIEQGSSFLIHRNKTIKSPGELFRPDAIQGQQPQMATQVFLIEYVDPRRVSAIIKTMVSRDALVELIAESKRMIVTDVAANIRKIAELLLAIDSPNSGLEIGQYVCQNAAPASMVSLARQLLFPLTKGQTFILVPNIAANSVFVVSSSFLVEKALSIMQTLDLGNNESRILSFEKLKFDEELAKKARAEALERQAQRSPQGFTEDEVRKLTPEEIRQILKERGLTEQEISKLTPDQIRKSLREMIELGPYAGRARAEVRKKSVFESTLPVGQVESTQFNIYQLQYRKSVDVVKALRSIATSLQTTSEKNVPVSDLVVTLNTVQTLDESNSLVLTGTSTTLQKAKELIADIDVPVRQVMIEVLVLDTTLANTLNFSLESSVAIKRSDFNLQGGFFPPGSSATTNALGTFSGTAPPSLTSIDLFGGGSPMGIPAAGLSTGSIGRKILFKKTGFLTMAGLLNALRTDVEAHIITSPSVTVEHNVPAEIFVGQIIGIKGQSISNDTGTIVTTNFETRQTGIDLKVTPLISSKDTVTLVIEQTISAANAQQVASQGQANAPPATINETRTLTRVHMPSEHFIVMSGMISDEKDINKAQIPCLGSLPLVGNLFAANTNQITKRNLMLFIRPTVIDTDIDIDDITKKRQDLWKKKSVPLRYQITPMDDALQILNLKP